ncbi:MAG: hypothetical protein MJ197_09685, partial [Bacteroidales bacterium]|nr:hypothetical protein [Bacteroidales bacterium]
PTCAGVVKLTTEEFIEKARRKHGDRYDYRSVKYVNSATKVRIVCPDHGEFLQVPNSHLQGVGCAFCSGRGQITTEIFRRRAVEVHGNKYDYSLVDFVDSKSKVKIRCPKHGVFEQQAGSHLRGVGCPGCSQSKLEVVCADFIKGTEVYFELQKKFSWLKDKALLPLDIYLPEYNVAIECQGIQHFMPKDFFGGEVAFNELVRRDQLKYRLCNSHGIKIYYYSVCRKNGSFCADYPYKVYEDLNELFDDIIENVGSNVIPRNYHKQLSLDL